MADLDLAAALVLALKSGLMSDRDVVRIVDEEILAREVADSWLMDASLAGSKQDLLHVLTERAAGHAMLGDGLTMLGFVDAAASHRWLTLETLVSGVLCLYPYTTLPDDLLGFAWDLDSLATGDHGERAPAGLAEQEQALRSLLAEARGRSRWREVVEQLVVRAIQRSES